MNKCGLKHNNLNVPLLHVITHLFTILSYNITSFRNTLKRSYFTTKYKMLGPTFQ